MSRITIRRKEPNRYVEVTLSHEEERIIYGILEKDYWIPKIVKKINQTPRSELRGFERSEVLSSMSTLEEIYHAFLARRSDFVANDESLEVALCFVLDELYHSKQTENRLSAYLDY